MTDLLFVVVFFLFHLCVFVDENIKMHGLESLIEYYMENPEVLAKGLILKEPVKGEQPPPDTRRHGHTNLLHRATSHGSYTVVKELLKTGYKHKHDVKNDEGQTAVHLASLNGKDDILRKLICHGAGINTRDTAGYTPLHVRNPFFKQITIVIFFHISVYTRKSNFFFEKDVIVANNFLSVLSAREKSILFCIRNTSCRQFFQIFCVCKKINFFQKKTLPTMVFSIFSARKKFNFFIS